MNKTILRLLCLIVCICTMIPVFASCKKDTGDGSDTSDTGADLSQGATVDENGYELDSIDRTLNGKVMKMLIDSSSEGDVLPDESTNGVNVLYDMSYIRRLELEDRLDCEFEKVIAPGENAGVTDFLKVAELAGDYKFDLVCAFSLAPAILAQRGLLVNLNTLVYPELEKPWWPDMISDWEYEGALYFVANNSSNRVIHAMENVLANKKMIEDNNLPSLEDVVIDGDWTLEVMDQYVRNISTENGEYGLVVDHYSRMDMFLYGTGNYLTRRNEDGNIELALFEQSSKDKVTSLVTKLGAILQNGTIMKEGADYSILTDASAMFFAISGLYAFTSRVDVDTPYMPLPAPKYDSDQDRYYVVPNNSYDMWCIPFSASNAEDSGLVLEALSSSDYRDFAPFLFEEKLRLRYSDDEKGAKIFDIIRNSVYVDFGRVCANALCTSGDIGVMETPFRNCFWSGGAFKVQEIYISELGNGENQYKANMKILLSAFKKFSK